jgi:hypothetical protein
MWEPPTKSQESGRGLVTWLPNRVMQQWRTGYLTTMQSNNNAGLVSWLSSKHNRNSRKHFYLVGLESTLKGDTTGRQERFYIALVFDCTHMKANDDNSCNRQATCD